MTIVLKHLAKEFKADPRKIRIILRKHFSNDGRWRWNEDDPQLIEVRKVLAEELNTK